MSCDERVPLSSVAELVSSKVAVSGLHGGPYISTENMLPDLGGVGASEYPTVDRVNGFRKHDTLFSNIRPYFRKVHYAATAGGCSADVLVFRTKNPEEFHPAYLYYCLADPTFIDYTMATSKGAKMPRGDKGAMTLYEVFKPAIEEQKRVASLLRNMDELIDSLRHQSVTLESMAQTLFRSWFVNFDPVHAKAADNIPEAMTAALAELFPSELDASELGLIPKGWSVSAYSETLNIHSGGTPKTSTSEYWGGVIPWFSVTDSPEKGQVFVLNTEKKITAEGLKNSPARLLPQRSTIISARGTVGKIGMVEGPMSINQSCYALSPKQLSGEYWVYFQTRTLVSRLKQMAHGGVFDTITKSTFDGLSVVVPTDDVQIQFSRVCAPMFDIIANNGRLCLALSQIRDHLLPRLISGKLSIEEAEALVEEAVAA